MFGIFFFFLVVDMIMHCLAICFCDSCVLYLSEILRYALQHLQYCFVDAFPFDSSSGKSKPF